MEGSPLGGGGDHLGCASLSGQHLNQCGLGVIFLLEVGENLDPPCQSQVSLTYWMLNTLPSFTLLMGQI